MEPTMKRYRFFLGIDRSDQHLDLCQLSENGEICNEVRLPTSPEDLSTWFDEFVQTLGKDKAAVCIEQPCASTIRFLARYDCLDIYAINPITLKRYREAFVLSRAKDDKKDALHLAYLVYEKG